MLFDIGFSNWYTAFAQSIKQGVKIGKVIFKTIPLMHKIFASISH